MRQMGATLLRHATTSEERVIESNVNNAVNSRTLTSNTFNYTVPKPELNISSHSRKDMEAVLANMFSNKSI
jgi:hypothetical protein